MKNKHKQIKLKLPNGRTIEVDEGVRSIIKLMNSIPGLETYNSCQGDRSNCAYVQFGGEKVFNIISLIAYAIGEESKVWKKDHQHDCCGCESMSISLEVSSGSIVLRWAPWDVGRVGSIVKHIKDGIRTSSVTAKNTISLHS